MSNIDIEIGPGNPAAVGVRFHVAQHCYLSHMDFRLGSARAGIEDIGNEVEDLHFHGGQYGIVTRRSAPGWPILVIDCTFDGQSQAAIAMRRRRTGDRSPPLHERPHRRLHRSRQAGRTLDQRRDDSRTSSGPALVISNENNARTQINLQNIACKDVPVLASFRESGKTMPGLGTSIRGRTILPRSAHRRPGR